MNDTVAFSPPSAEFDAHGFDVAYLSGEAPFVINEISALNETGPEDEAGDRDDWLELFNDSSGWWSTGGYFLTDDLGVPTRWQLPDLVVPPRGFVRVWCDGEPEQGFLHASFRLSSEGDQIHLITPAEDGYRVADSVRFGRQAPDASTGRACDGGDAFRVFSEPTPGSSNGDDCRAAGLALPGDCQADGNVDITDAICMLTYLFLGREPTAPCKASGDLDAGVRALLDVNGDRELDLSDTVSLLNFLFLNGAAPVLGRDCAAIPLCEDVCLD